MSKRRLFEGPVSLAGAWTAGIVLAGSLALARPHRAQGENVHQPDADCSICHTAGKTALQADAGRARTLVRADVDALCNRCHAAEGPSHKTGVKAKGAVPADLPLSAEGRLTCATCHFVHGEDNRFGDFVRYDNRRGKLCLSCHKLSELK